VGLPPRLALLPPHLALEVAPRPASPGTSRSRLKKLAKIPIMLAGLCSLAFARWPLLAGLCSLAAFAASCRHGCSNRRPTENRHNRWERRAGRTPGHFLERTAAMLRMRGYGHFSDADVTDVAKLALTGLAHQPAA